MACGTSYPEAAAPPARCAICTDERQYVPAQGQAWTGAAALAGSHANAWRRPELDLYELETQPAFAIGQRAFLIRTPAGNILWDCVALLDKATRGIVAALGGIAAIAISHPHYYTTAQDWADAFSAPVYLHHHDREWLMRPSDRIRFWEGDRHLLLPGMTLVRLGGHFPGGSVLHWADGAGALLSGDILQVGADRASVSFLWSYPNNLPLSGTTVARIARAVADLRFQRIYGAFGQHVTAEGDRVVQRSAARYCALLAEEQP